MIEFWLAALGLLILAAGFMLGPLWQQRKQTREKHLLEQQLLNRNQQNVAIYKTRLAELQEDLAAERIENTQFQALKLELEASLLSDVPENSAAEPSAVVASARPAILVGVAMFVVIAIASLWLYARWGAIDEVAIAQLMEQRPSNEAEWQARAQKLAQLLTEQTERHPEDPKNYYLLARVYTSMQNYAQAAVFYAKAIALLSDEHPEKASVLGRYAEALYASQPQGGSTEDGLASNQRIRQLAEQALALQADEPTSLGLLGIMAYERADYPEAIEHWQRLLALTPSGPEAEALRMGVEQARLAMGEAPTPSMNDQVHQGLVAGADTDAKAEIRVMVELDPRLIEQTEPSDILFVLARPHQGPRMPLAVTRLQVKDLPKLVVLDESMSMDPMLNLSQFEQAEVVARISKSGQPMAQAGDIQGRLGPIPVQGADVLTLRIDQVLN